MRSSRCNHKIVLHQYLRVIVNSILYFLPLPGLSIESILEVGDLVSIVFEAGVLVDYHRQLQTILDSYVKEGLL